MPQHINSGKNQADLHKGLCSQFLSKFSNKDPVWIEWDILVSWWHLKN